MGKTCKYHAEADERTRNSRKKIKTDAKKNKKKIEDYKGIKLSFSSLIYDTRRKI